MFSSDCSKDAFKKYSSNYKPEDPKVALKIAHTYRVADMSYRIANSIGLNDDDRELAWLIGLLHDIGRFEQIRRYHTFTDSESCNHAELSADILFKDNLIRSFTDDPANDTLIEKAIRLHNRFELPADLSERERTFSTILRDADKVDIFRVNCDTPIEDIYDYTTEQFKSSALSDIVYETALSHQNVKSCFVVTPADIIVAHICLVFGLVYSLSFRMTKEQGYLDHMMQFASDNTETQSKLAHFYKEVRQFVDSSCS